MKCKILHESEGRMRVHVCAGHMSCRQADILEYYLASKDGVVSVKVYERTGNAAVCYVGARDGVIEAFAAFSYETAERSLDLPEHTGREMNHEYEEKLVMRVVWRALKRLFLPEPVRVALSWLRAAQERGLDHEERHSRVEYVVAHGIASEVDGAHVVIGSYHFVFEDEGCRIPRGEKKRFDALPAEYSHLYLALNGKLSAVILIEDPVRAEAADAVARLRELGFTNLVMMTGDSERTAAAVAQKLGLDDYRAEVLPEDKARFVKEAREAGHTVVMVGDGINDSPALSEADVGVAISTGAAIAREIADVTVSEDDLFALVALRELSEALMRRIRGNYRTIMSFNLALILLGVFGVLPPATSALLHNGSTVAIGLHSMTRLLDDEKEKRA